jgi:hypothetical protein
MAAIVFNLADLPSAPHGRYPQVRRARRYLEATHASVNGLIESFNLVREATAESRGTAAGRLRRDEVDLLRAALIFTSSGVDASCQTLVRDCLPDLVGHGTAKIKFDLFLEAQARQPTEAFLTAIKAANPRAELVALYLEEKTRASYQGTNDLKDRVRDLLGIPNQAMPISTIEGLAGFFIARNDIVHRLDYVDPKSRSTARHHRAPADVISECNRVLVLVSALIQGVADVL